MRAGEVLQSMYRDEDKLFRLEGGQLTLVLRSAANIEALLLQRLDCEYPCFSWRGDCPFRQGNC